MNLICIGIIDVLEKMGVMFIVDLINEGVLELVVNIIIEIFLLKGIEIGGDIIFRLIDEIFVIVLVVM